MGVNSTKLRWNVTGTASLEIRLRNMIIKDDERLTTLVTSVPMGAPEGSVGDPAD